MKLSDAILQIGWVFVNADISDFKISIEFESGNVQIRASWYLSDPDRYSSYTCGFQVKPGSSNTDFDRNFEHRVNYAVDVLSHQLGVADAPVSPVEDK